MKHITNPDRSVMRHIIQLTSNWFIILADPLCWFDKPKSIPHMTQANNDNIHDTWSPRVWHEVHYRFIISYYTICIEPVPSTAQFMNQRDIMTDSIDCQKLMLTCAKALWYARIIDRWMKHLKLCWQTCGNHTISCRIPQTIICQRLFNIHCKLAVKSGDVCDQISQTESPTLLKHPSNYWHESLQAFSWKSVLVTNANWNISAPSSNRITCCTKLHHCSGASDMKHTPNYSPSIIQFSCIRRSSEKQSQRAS